MSRTSPTPRRGPKLLSEVPADHLRLMVRLLRAQVAMLEKRVDYQQRLLRELSSDGLMSL